eukprot:121189_1
MSTKPERNPKWNKLLYFPFTYFSQPFVVNNDEFMVVPYKTFDCDGDGIYKFNTQKNEWTKIFDYEANFNCSAYSVAYDNKHKLLYICDINTGLKTRMSTFDLKTTNKVTSKTEQYEDLFGLIFVEDKLHKICPLNGDHYIYDKTNQFQKITTFKSLKDLYKYGFIYLQSQKTMLLFGGFR